MFATLKACGFSLAFGTIGDNTFGDSKAHYYQFVKFYCVYLVGFGGVLMCLI